MSEDGLAVRRLLPATFERMDEAVKQAALAQPQVDQAKLPGFVWPIVGAKATEAVCQALDCDVFSLMARAWQTARELHGFKDETRYPPDKTAVAFLGKHDLTTSAQPVVDVSFGESLNVRLRFTLVLTAQIRGVELTIRAGHIVAIAAGDASVSAQLKYGDIPLHDPLKSRDVRLSGSLTLPAPGLAIL